MTPIYQTRFRGGDAAPDEQGNCLAAAFASLLDVPLSEVDFITNSEDEHWFDPWARWLDERNAPWSWLIASPTTALEEGKLGRHWAPQGLSIASGPSPRGQWLHAVVACDGLIKHDPWPNGAIGPAYFVDYFVLTAEGQTSIPLVKLPKDRRPPHDARWNEFAGSVEPVV